MKYLSSLLILLSFTAQAALPPTRLKGQNDASFGVTFDTQVPANQATRLSGTSALIETGNKNLLINPSFEAPAIGTAWSLAGGVAAATSTDRVDGAKSSQLTLTTVTDQLIFQQLPVQTVARDFEISIWVKTALTTVQVCSLSGVVETQCVSVPSANTWSQIVINQPTDTTNLIGMKVKTTASSSGVVLVDDAYMGPPRNIGSVSQARPAFSAYFPVQASCLWTRVAAALSDFTAVAACLAPVVEYSDVGQVQTIDADLPQITVNNLPAGTYRMTAYPTVYTGGIQSSIALTDSTTTCQNGGNDGSTGIITPVTCTFKYDTSGTRTFKIQGAMLNTGTTQYIQNISLGKNLRFVAEFFPNTAQQAIRSDQSNYDWRAWTPTVTGLGTPTLSGCLEKRDGPDNLLKCNVTSGTSTATALTFTLPNGNTTDANKMPTGGIYANVGDMVSSITSASSPKRFAMLGLGGSQTISVSLAETAGATGALTPANGSAVATSGNVLSFTARVPIAGWTENQKAPQLIGSVISATTGVFRVEAAKLLASGAIVTQHGSDWLTGSCTVVGATTTCPIKPGYFSATPSCWGNRNIASGTATSPVWLQLNTSTSTSVAGVFADGGSGFVSDMNLYCMGPR